MKWRRAWAWGVQQGAGGCIAHVISLTSPRDACRLSVVSAAFRSAAASDAVWQRFLPPDFPSILSRAAAAVDLGCSSKKDLFFRLCHHPLLLLHAPTPSFWLDKSSGAKCYMLLARALSIAWGDTPEYWAWNRIPDARFGEVAELLDVCWLEIVGRIGSSALSPKTAYAAYLVFKIADDWHGLHCPKQETCRTQNAAGNYGCWGDISADEERRLDGGGDGEFYNETGEDGEVEMSLREIRGRNWKKGLLSKALK
uniref:Uncharacterized protein n=1 Tax=Ananas comosus var. bracteatus TaxID=296719 RepID=A0A6V7PJ53_ANACO|nr:unnamed protein product [Ananas comosus var. bracteatus]